MSESGSGDFRQKLIIGFVLLLSLNYFFGIWQAFRRPQPSPNRLKSELVLSQRLGLAGEFCVQMPSPLSKGLSALAQFVEKDGQRRELLAGSRPRQLNSESLPPGLRTLLLYREDPTAELNSELTILAYRGLIRLNICFAVACVLVVGAGLLCFLGSGSSESAKSGEPPTILATLLFFTAWIFWSGRVMGFVLRELGPHLPGIGFMILGQVLSLFGLALLSRFALGRSWPSSPSCHGWRWVGLGYFFSLGVINLLEWSLQAWLGREVLTSVSTWLFFLDANPSQRLFLIVIAVVLAPLVEEYVYRYCLLEGLAPRLGDWKACLVVSLVFALGHGELLAVPGLTVLGLIFGAVYLKTRSLWPSVLLHALWNATTLCGLFASLP